MHVIRNISAAFFSVFLLACSKEDHSTKMGSLGDNMLLIGNSFFKPYAERLNDMAVDAGFEQHSSVIIKRGNDSGRPINFWNDSLSTEHNLIKATLDQGNIDVFGMTSGHDVENPTEGHKAWIEYALQSNPRITVFIAIPTIHFPADWDQLVQESGFDSIQELYSHFVNETVHKGIVDELRAEFPTINIFTVPTGWSAINLVQMYVDDLLLDDIDILGPKPTSIFTDQKGHQGQIVIETGAMIWLNSIYDVDLKTYNYQTGFDTDLHSIAQEIVNGHDSSYKR